MLSPKRMIPSLAVAALPLTGTACSSGGGASPTENFANSIRTFCMKIVECYPNSYDSADDCVATYQIDIDRAQDLPANCINAVASYFNCLGSLTCEEYASDAFYQCDEEFGGLIDEACSVPPA